jgi:SPFH domain / Band 7 family
LPLQVFFVAKSGPKSNQQSRSGILLLGFLILGSSVVAGLFFQDYREVPYGWFITVVWLVAAGFSCAFGVIYYAQFVLPHREGENWLEGIAMMLRSATYFGPSASQMSSGRAAAAKKPDTLNSSFRTLQAGMVPSHLALALGKGDGFARAAGPGFVRLQPGERPIQLVDLRPHVRSDTAAVNTRDGIPVDMKVNVVFQVKQSERDHEGDQLAYPYDKSAIFWVSQLKSFDQNDAVRPWSEQIAPQAAAYMISEVAQYSLDELWQDPSIFNGIQQRIRRQLRTNFDEWGVKIHRVKVAPVKIPDQIAAQRMANWRAPWQSQILAQAAAGNAEALRRVKIAKARAQVEIIEKTMQSIDEMRQIEAATLPEIVTLRVIDVLEDAATKGSTQGYLPGQLLSSMVLDSPSQIQTTQEPTSPEGDSSDE